MSEALYNIYMAFCLQLYSFSPVWILKWILNEVSSTSRTSVCLFHVTFLYMLHQVL